MLDVDINDRFLFLFNIKDMKNKKIWFVVIIIVATIVVLIVRPTTNKEDVRVGNILFLSGTMSALGEQELDGMTMAQEYINSTGGIHGRKLSIITQDFAGDSKKAIPAYNFLRQQGIRFFFFDGSAGAVPLVPLVRQNGDMSIVPTAVHPAYFDGEAKTCRVALTVKSLTQGTGEYLFGKFEKPRVAFFVSANEYGGIMRKEIGDFIEKTGGNIVMTETFDPLAGFDFRTQVTKLKAKQNEIDALIIINGTNSIEPMLRELKTLGFTKQIIGDTYTIMNASLKDKSLAEGAIFVDYAFTPEPNPSDPEHLIKFKKEFFKKYNMYPVAAAINGYDGVMILATAMKGAKDITPESVSDYIVNTMKTYEGVGGTLKFNSDCEVERAMVTRVIKDGKAVILE